MGIYFIRSADKWKFAVTKKSALNYVRAGMIKRGQVFLYRLSQCMMSLCVNLNIDCKIVGFFFTKSAGLRHVE